MAEQVKRPGANTWSDNPAVTQFPTDQRRWNGLTTEMNRKYVTGSFTPTMSGWSSGPNGPSAVWVRNDNFITISFGFVSTGTSDATTISMSGIPLIITPVVNVWVSWSGPATDNGVASTYVTGAVEVQADSTADFYTLASGGVWTAANSKGWSLTNQCTFTYPLFPPS